MRAIKGKGEAVFPPPVESLRPVGAISSVAAGRANSKTTLGTTLSLRPIVNQGMPRHIRNVSCGPHGKGWGEAQLTTMHRRSR